MKNDSPAPAAVDGEAVATAVWKDGRIKHILDDSTLPDGEYKLYANPATANSAEGKVVPDEIDHDTIEFDNDIQYEYDMAYADGWNACREAMLNATARTSRGS